MVDNKVPTPEQIDKACAYETPEEIIALAQAEGYELSDEGLKSVSAGGWSPKKALPQCPGCGSYAIMNNPLPATGCVRCTCRDCGYQWTKTALDPILPTSQPTRTCSNKNRSASAPTRQRDLQSRSTS